VEIQTTRFGELNIKPEAVLCFSKPLLGLSGSKRYVFVEAKEDSPFKWLQSCDEPGVALVLTEPEVFFSDYEVKIQMEDLGHLLVEDGDDLILMVVLVVPPDPKKITANLLAPVLINLTKRLAGQLVLADSRYSTRHLIFPQTDWPGDADLDNQNDSGRKMKPNSKMMPESGELARVSGGA
jgi:flagellar assembly factor FliW